MKNKIVIPLALAFGLLIISQPAFAMKRTNSGRPGHVADQTNAVVSSVAAALKWLFAEMPSLITFVSQTGSHFDVSIDELSALIELAPTIGELLSDLQGSDVSTVDLGHVGSQALHLLTQMARGNYDLKQFLIDLTPGEIEKLKRDAFDLDSQALQDLISTIENPFDILPNDMLVLIFAQIGPRGRTECRSVSRPFRTYLDRAKVSISEGGLGWTDILPVVATIQLSGDPLTPAAHGHLLFVENQQNRTISVFDSVLNQVILTIQISILAQPPFVFGQRQYMPNYRRGTLSVIDLTQNQVMPSIRVGRGPRRPVAHGQMLYIANFLDGTVSAVDSATNQVVQTIQVGEHPLPPVLHGQVLYVVCAERSIYVIDIGGYLPGQY